MLNDNRIMGTAIAAVGLVIAAIGVLMYVDEKDIIIWASVLAAGAVIAVIGILILAEFIGGTPAGKPAAKKADAPKAVKAKPSAAPAAVSFGNTPLAKAMNNASAMVSGKSAAGKISGAQAASFMERIGAFKERIGKDEDAALVSLSQLMGAIAKA